MSMGDRFLEPSNGVEDQYKRMAASVPRETVYMKNAETSIVESLGYRFWATHRLPGEFPSLILPALDPVQVLCIDAERRASNGGRSSLSAPRLYPHPKGATTSLPDILSMLSPAAEIKVNGNPLPTLGAPTSLLSGPLSGFANHVPLGLMHDITIFSEKIIVVYVAFIWVARDHVGRCRIFFGSQCPLNRYITIPETALNAAEAALLIVECVTTYLTSLGLRHLCIVSGDPFTLGCLSASFNDGDDPVGTGLQVPLVGWRGIHLSLMSRIKTELKEWGKWWYLIYGQGAVLDHLYSSLAAGDSLGERSIVTTNLVNPREYQALGPYALGCFVPDTNYLTTRLAHFNQGQSTDYENQGLDQLVDQEAQLRVGNALRSLGMYHGPYFQNGLNFDQSGWLIVQIATYGYSPGLHLGHVLFGDHKHPLDLDLLHYNETNDLLAGISTLSFALYHAGNLGFKNVCIFRKSTDLSGGSFGPFPVAAVATLTGSPIQALCLDDLGQPQGGDLKKALSTVDRASIITCDGPTYGRHRADVAREMLLSRMRMDDLSTLSGLSPPGADKRATLDVRTGSSLLSEHGNGLVMDNGPLCRHSVLYLAGSSFKPETIHTMSL